jgi:hypothetical protein
MADKANGRMSINDLLPDPKQARRRTPRSEAMIEASLREVGAARSIVIDEDNVTLAGNGTVAGAKAAGIKNVRVIDADGDEIIAVRRSNLTDEQKVKLALFDNRTGELAAWDTEALAAIVKEMPDAATGMWTADELMVLAEWLPPIIRDDQFAPVMPHHGIHFTAAQAARMLEIVAEYRELRGDVSMTDAEIVMVICEGGLTNA